MKYILQNVEDDDFVAEVLSELECEIGTGDSREMKVVETVKSDKVAKGVGIFGLVVEIAEWSKVNGPYLENIMIGMLASGLYDLLKMIINRLKRIPEYKPEKKIQIVQEDNQGNRIELVITVREFLEKDVRKNGSGNFNRN